MRALSLSLALLIALPALSCGKDLSELGLSLARKRGHWDEPTKPVHVAGPLYFVGTEGLAVWVFQTSEGLIVLNTGMPGSGPLIEDSIRKLGMKPEDMKILLSGHAHVDHVGGHAYLKGKYPDVQVAMIAEEVELLESGGRLDFQYGGEPDFAFQPVKVDRTFHDGDVIRLGDVALTAHLTPGHTKGATTFTTTVTDGGKSYAVVFAQGTSVNPGYRLVKDPSYPGIADDYRKTFALLGSLAPDIWFDAHTEVFDFAGKRSRAAREGVAAWVDPTGYRKWLTDVNAKFDATVRRQS